VTGVNNVLLAYGSGAAAFTPASISGLIGWYDASYGGNTITSGNFTAVADRSGSSNNLGNSNTVPYNATSAYNSMPAFDFAKANNAGLIMPSATASGITTAASIFIVGRANSGMTGFAGISPLIGTGQTNDFDNTNSLVFSRSGSDQIESFYNSGTIADSNYTAATNMRFGFVIGSGTLTQYINNSAATSNSISFSIGTSFAIAMGNRWLSGTLAGFPWDGPMCEVVIYSVALTTQNRSDLDNYFTTKWGS
jgi:hypothetical protein